MVVAVVVVGVVVVVVDVGVLAGRASG